MATGEPLSLKEVLKLSGSADTILLTATRNADLETPIGAFMRFDDDGPAFLLESVEGGERLGRYSFLGVGPRRLLMVAGGTALGAAAGSGSGTTGVTATIQTRPLGVHDFAPDLPKESFEVANPVEALRRFLPRRRVAHSTSTATAEVPRFAGGAVGALAYDAVSTFEPTVPLPARDPFGTPLAAFQETDLVLVFDHLHHTLSAVASLHTETPDIEGRYRIAERAIFDALERTGRPTAAEMQALARRSDGAGSTGAAAGDSRNRPDRLEPERGLEPVEVSLERGEYEAAVRDAKEAIAAGECIQIVVARRQTFERPIVRSEHGSAVRLDPVDVYRSLRRINPSPYLFFVRMPDFTVVGASPELLVRVEEDRMTTHPIAGTRPRGATEREDEQLAEQLRNDPKERAEHVMLVDLGRNDLGRVARAGSVAVTKYMEVERYSHVLHLVSNVEGRLRPDRDALDALRSIFPAGTLSGAPKIRAMQLIAEAERERRGLYGGTAGYLGYDGNIDTAITIRSAVMTDDRIHVSVGAGIVAGSVPEREFEETEHKTGAIRRALEQAVAEASPAAAAAQPGPAVSPVETPR